MLHLNRKLLDLTHPYVGRADLVQGPGGNTSVKDGLGNMMIKASGFRFEEIDSIKGFSIVNDLIITKYFNEVQVVDKVAEEQRSVALILENVLKNSEGEIYPKPSMETGFHAVLDQYVVHTHSVWANLVNCNHDNHILIKKIEEKLEISIVIIPYVSPGFGLSYLVNQKIMKARKENQKIPQIFFLENHGIIAHGTSIHEVHKLLSDIDSAIMDIFLIENSYPETGIVENDNHSYVPNSSFVPDQIRRLNIDSAFFEQVLFPDQIVFFKDNISFNGEHPEKKIQILPEKIIYQANYRESISIHETMTAFFFILDTIKKSGGSTKFIPPIEQDYINGMDMEIHRRNLMK